MSLTNAEERQLEEIERGLSAEAPRLALLLAPAAVHRRIRLQRSARWTETALLVVGVVLFLAGLGTRLPGVAVAGVITAVLGPVLAHACASAQERHGRLPR